MKQNRSVEIFVCDIYIGDGKKAIYDRHGIVLGHEGADSYLTDIVFDYQGVNDAEYYAKNDLIMVYAPQDGLQNIANCHTTHPFKPIYFQKPGHLLK